MAYIGLQILRAPVALIGGATAIAGAISQRSAANKQADLARESGQRNAQIAISQAEAEETRRRRVGRRQLGRIRASIGARGITVEGSPMNVLADQAAEIEEEALLIRFGGRQRAETLLFGATIEEQRQRAFGRAALFRGIGQGIASFGGAAAGASILGPASSIPTAGLQDFDVGSPSLLAPAP